MVYLLASKLTSKAWIQSIVRKVETPIGQIEMGFEPGSASRKTVRVKNHFFKDIVFVN